MDLSKINKYINKYRQRVQLLIYNDEFYNDVTELRAKWSIPQYGFDSLDEGVNSMLERDPNKESGSFLGDIHDVTSKFNLTPNWSTGIMCYVLTHDEQLMLAAVGLPTERISLSENGSDEITINIDEFTTLEDIKTLWPEIKKAQKDVSTSEQEKQQPIPNIDRYIRAKQLRSEGKTSNEIADILTDEAGKTISYDDVNTYIHRFNQQSARYYDTKHA